MLLFHSFTAVPYPVGHPLSYRSGFWAESSLLRSVLSASISVKPTWKRNAGPVISSPPGPGRMRDGTGLRTICPIGQTKVAIPETLDFIGIVTETKVSKKQYKNNFGRIQSNTDFPVDCYSFEHKKPVFGLLFGHCGSIINFVKVYPNWKKIPFPWV